MTTPRQRWIAAGSILVILLCIANGLRGCSPDKKGSMREAALAFEEALGSYCGEVIAKELGTGASVVLLSFATEGVEALERQQTAMENALEQGAVQIAGRESIPTDHPLSMLVTLQSGFPAQHLEEVRATYSEAAAVISLAGAPLYPPRTRPASAGPRLMIAPYIGSHEILGPLAQRRLLSLVIARHQNPKTLLEASRQADPRAQAEAMYGILRP